jgi:hypothetical protein
MAAFSTSGDLILPASILPVSDMVCIARHRFNPPRALTFLAMICSAVRLVPARFFTAGCAPSANGDSSKAHKEHQSIRNRIFIESLPLIVQKKHAGN